MSTHSLRDLRGRLGTVVREVAYSGEEAIVTDNGREIAVIISLADYERLHEHADIVDALRLREMRVSDFSGVTLADVCATLDVRLEDLEALAG